MTFAAVCLVGGLGAVCRFGLDSLVSRRAPGGWGTFAEGVPASEALVDGGLSSGLLTDAV